MSHYLATLPLRSPLEPDDVRLLARKACLDLHRVSWLRCYVADDASQMLCWHEAPDAEAVRLVLRQQGAAGAAVVPVRVDGAPAGEPLESDRDGLILELEGGAASEVRAALAALGSLDARIFVPRHAGRSVVFVRTDDEAQVAALLGAVGLAARASWRCRELDPRPPRLFRSQPGKVRDGAGTAQPHSARPDALPQPDIHIAARRPDEVLDAVIVGAGLSGIAMLERLARMGCEVRAYESGSDVGGVWHWNRYPGARVDSESYTYGFAFSPALLEEWDWGELFAPQPEIARYLRYAVDRLGLRQHIRCNTRVTAARFDERTRHWHIETEHGERVTARYLVAAAGTLSAPQLPEYPGRDVFAGRSFHTARWPDGVDLRGKRVGVIGTGATGVQVIQTIAADVGQLTVFQRTPTYCIPQRNRALTDEDRSAIRRDWGKILDQCRASFGGFIHNFHAVSGLAVSPEEREAKFEELWQRSGFAFWFANFGDLMMNDEVNAHACEFLRRKIAARVHDPEVARRLLPDHPFGCKRVPLEHGYYEAFNRPNVRLVDLRETPIERITPTGIRTAAEEHALDVIVYATGFDAGTGALVRIDLQGNGDATLAQKWRTGAQTYLGMLVHGFPNFFMVNGPQNAAAFCNAGRCVEPNVEWIASCLEEMRARRATRIEPDAAAETEWTRHVDEVAAATVLAKMTDSWLYGANTPGKARRITIYAAGARAYREHCEGVARTGFPGLVMS
jgi:cation diffusion facilitator CzcD-associated flavoprotein CzcO